MAFYRSWPHSESHGDSRNSFMLRAFLLMPRPLLSLLRPEVVIKVNHRAPRAPSLELSNLSLASCCGPCAACSPTRRCHPRLSVPCHPGCQLSMPCIPRSPFSFTALSVLSPNSTSSASPYPNPTSESLLEGNTNFFPCNRDTNTWK